MIHLILQCHIKKHWIKIIMFTAGALFVLQVTPAPSGACLEVKCLCTFSTLKDMNRQNTKKKCCTHEPIKPSNRSAPREDCCPSCHCMLTGMVEDQLYIILNTSGHVPNLLACKVLYDTGISPDYGIYRCSGALQCRLRSHPIFILNSTFLI
jgi:hypothetical protein